MRWLGGLMACACLVAGGNVARAYDATVDGDPREWWAADPPVANLGHIARNESFEGEYRWLDPVGDRSPLFDAAGANADMAQVAVTASGEGLYFLIVLPGLETRAGEGAPMIQIALDLDQRPGSGRAELVGGAETSVDEVATWELLVQTTFGSGAGTPVIHDAAGGEASAGEAAIGEQAIEIHVPWGSVGGRPDRPIRFTVASFLTDRFDGVLDDGTTGSNAVDCVTNYGTPGDTLGTEDEVFDGAINYWFDVWFHLDAQWNPSAPVLITEIHYNPTGGDPEQEYVELFSAADQTIDFAPWATGDEAIPGGPEAMMGFPAGATIDPGEVQLVAYMDQAFQEAHGFDPDYEQRDSDPFVPQMVPDPRWGNAELMILGNDGDEVLLVDAAYTVVDAVTWGTGSYPTVTPESSVGTAALIRDVARQDRDDVPLDFSHLDPTPGVAAGACALQTDGTPCDDGDYCTTGDVCIAESCTSGSTATCPGDGNECTQDACDPGFILGCYPILAPGTACTDTTTDDCWDAACDAAGTCDQTYAAESSTYVCRPEATGSTCDVAESCTGTGGACPTDGFRSASTVCRSADGDCDLAESCTGTDAFCPDDAVRPSSTVCRTSTDLCDAEELCDGVSKTCPTDALEPSGTVCRSADGPCDVAETCSGSSESCPSDAVRSSGYVCRAPAGDCDVAETCDGATTACPSDAREPSTTVCRASMGDCDLAESCDGTDVDCPADLVVASGAECRAAAGACDVAEACDGSSPMCPMDELASAGTVCRPADGPCDVTESCTGTAVTCPTDGYEPDGTDCADSLVCDGSEVCDSGACVMGTALDCDDGDLCTSNMCVEPTGCEATAISGCCNNDADCGDGDICTADQCSGPGGTCSSTAITNCCVSDSDCDDGVLCTTDACNTSTNRCEFTAITGCCTTDGDCADSNACTTDSCDLVTGACSNDAVAGCCNTNGDCDDGDLCTSDQCSGTGGTCSFPAIAGCCTADSDCGDADACTADSCDLLSNTCDFGAIPGCCLADSDCDDSDACTTDTCESNECVHDPVGGCGVDGGLDAGMDGGGLDAGMDGGGLDAGPEDGGPDAGDAGWDGSFMMGGDASVGEDAGGGEDLEDESSCSCRAAGAGGGPASGGLLALAGLMVIVLRRWWRRR